MQQSNKKVVKLGSDCKYNQNNNIVINLLGGRIRSTSLSEITSCKETEHGIKQCLQSRHRMLKSTNVEYLYLLAGTAPPDNRRDVCARI